MGLRGFGAMAAAGAVGLLGTACTAKVETARRNVVVQTVPGEPAAQGPQEPQAPTSLRCDRFTFPESALYQDPLTDESDPAVVRARAELRNVMPELAAAPLRQLLHEHGDILFAVGSMRPGQRGMTLAYISLVEDGLNDTGYRFGNSGGCTLRPALPKAVNPGEWALAPESKPVRPDATELHLLVNELACHGSASPIDRINEAGVEYRPDSVVVTITFRAQTGDFTCPGTPPVPYTLKLREPVGNRALLDGAVYPAAPPPDSLR